METYPIPVSDTMRERIERHRKAIAGESDPEPEIQRIVCEAFLEEQIKQSSHGHKGVKIIYGFHHELDSLHYIRKAY